jgi:hypothetical protein
MNQCTKNFHFYNNNNKTLQSLENINFVSNIQRSGFAIDHGGF